MAKITVCISAYNEEKKLGKTLESVKWADDIVVVDNSSTDTTAAIAGKFTKSIYSRPNLPMLNTNKNFAFGKATGDWILCLDADEVVPDVLAREIRRTIVKTNAPNGFWIPRKNVIFGKWVTHGLWWPDTQLRLFRRGKGKFPCVHIHEYLEVEGPTGNLVEPYVHYNYETVSQFLYKMEHIYTENEVQRLVDTDYRISWYDAIRFPVSDFVKIFFAQEGYKDGLHGLVLSMLQAFYSFIVFAKLWERKKFEEKDIPLSSVIEELGRTGKDIRYWSLTARIKSAKGQWQKLVLKTIRRITSRF